MSSQITAPHPNEIANDATTASLAPVSQKAALEFKGLSHPALRVIINDASTHHITQTLNALAEAGSHGFEWQPVIIDASRLSPQDHPDWAAIVTGLRALRLHPVGLAGAGDGARERASALQLGWLAALPEPKRRPASTAATSPQADPTPPAPPTPSSAASVEFTRLADPLIIDRPVRSGQQVYAKERDLIVVGGVSPGAEVLADGHIHIYGPLGGRAIAGARGRRDASIFTLALQAELVAVCGIYRTFEEGLPTDLADKPVRIALDLHADTLSVKGL